MAFTPPPDRHLHLRDWDYIEKVEAEMLAQGASPEEAAAWAIGEMLHRLDENRKILPDDVMDSIIEQMQRDQEKRQQPLEFRPHSSPLLASISDQIPGQSSGTRVAQTIAAIGTGVRSVASDFERLGAQALKSRDVVVGTALAIQESIRHALGDVAAGAFDAYADALDRSMSLNELFSAQTGRAMENAVSSALKGLGRTAMAHSAEELAYAAMTAINPQAAWMYGPAIGHLEAAGMWLGVAALAGAGSAATSVAPGRSGAGSSGGTASSGSAAGLGSTSGGPVVNITVIGSLDADAREDLARQIAYEVGTRDAGSSGSPSSGKHHHHHHWYDAVYNHHSS